MKFDQKKVIITGGGKGIGKAISLAFASKGADVVISYRSDKEKALNLVDEMKEMGCKAAAFYGDFQDKREVQKFLTESLEFLGRVDILVNNAGTFSREDLFELEEKSFENVFGANVKIPFLFIQEVAGFMKQKKIQGSIINISSISGSITPKGKIGYGVTKAALDMLTKKAAVELAPYGIRVNSVAPGVVAVGMNESLMKNDPEGWKRKIANIPLGRPGKPEDQAAAVLFLASDEASWITGQILSVDGGHSLFFEL